MHKLPKFEREQLLAESLKNPAALETYEKIIFGKQMAHLRKKMKLTQNDLAKKLKTAQSAVARIEAGKQNLTMRTLIRIGFLLGKRLTINFNK